ncbi:uncharacterized protein LAJ45_02194 [Morchella importuna]|uniref:uncharacterized protein n=1 Tax=Morchella importuna TaxID=1174673 RepID=UPI001E8D3ED7|nr:uncharacterized protein LAJ45_02194 [Morchella importuna]KAH8153382.1 hypothetical protein LAJ45_02194 [Morchella importuna]
MAPKNKAPPAVPVAVVDRVRTDGRLVASFADDSEEEIRNGSHTTAARKAAYWGVRAMSKTTARAAHNAKLEKLRTVIRRRLRSPLFLAHLANVTAPAQQVVGAHYGPRGSIRPGRHNNVWKFRSDYGPATVKRKTFVVKTLGRDPGRTVADFYNEELTQRIMYYKNVIPVPRVLFGQTPGFGNGLAECGVPQQTVMVMEDIKGRRFTGNMDGWSLRKKNQFCMQLAGIRVHLLQMRSTHIGSMNSVIGLPNPVRVPGDCTFHRDRPIVEGNVSGEMRDYTQYANGRDVQRTSDGAYAHGPYATTIEFVASCLERERLYWAGHDTAAADAPGGTGLTGAQRAIWLTRVGVLQGYFAKRAADRLAAPPDPPETGNYRFCHRDLDRGRNIMVRGTKIVAILDWENSSYLPLSEAFEGLNRNEESLVATELRTNLMATAAGNPALTPTLPQEAISTNAGYHDYAEGPGSDYDSDLALEGVRMYGDSDGGDYDSEDENKQVPMRNPDPYEEPGIAIPTHMPPYDWWNDFISPKVGLFVFSWLMEQVNLCLGGPYDHPDMQLVMESLTDRNALLKYCTSKQIDPLLPFPAATEEDVKMLIREFPDETNM